MEGGSGEESRDLYIMSSHVESGAWQTKEGVMWYWDSVEITRLGDGGASERLDIFLFVLFL